MTEKPTKKKDQKINKELLIEALGGNTKLVEEFERFRDREKERYIRKEIELKARDILENELVKENEAALEVQNKVYRKAWSLACKKLKYPEEEFPSKY